MHWASRGIVDACWFVFGEDLKVASIVRNACFAWFSGTAGWDRLVGMVAHKKVKFGWIIN